MWPELRHRLLDFHDQRLRLMDASGVEIMVTSLNAPAIQAIADIKQAAEVAHRERYPRGGGRKASRSIRGRRCFADARAGDRDARARTLHQRSAFKGALVNGYSQTNDAARVLHYDLPQYRSFWRVVESLDVPFYLHPRPPSVRSPLYQGHSWLLGPTWSFAAETSVHALRLIGSGSVRRACGAADHSRPPWEGLPSMISGASTAGTIG